MLTYIVQHDENSLIQAIMFPTVAYLIEYLFGIKVDFPLPTFGLFVAFAFIFSYFTFLSEFKRKEKEGVIKPFIKVQTKKGATLEDYFEYGLLGYLLGWKFFGAFYYSELFKKSPLSFIFSWQGTWIVGIPLAALFMYLIFWYKKQKISSKPHLTTITIHPYELMPKLMIWTAFWGFIGAKVFNFSENYQRFSTYTLDDYLKYGGLTFLGGLTFGAITYLYIGRRAGIKLIDLADIGSPGMMVAYGVGRIGCQLAGDGDWGIVNNFEKPFAWLPDWMWSFNFPYNVLNQGQYIRGCGGNYCAILRDGVFPTSIYESVVILGAFAIIWALRRKIKLPGNMFFIYLLVIGFERFFMEEIRVNYKYQIIGLELSQAQIISLVYLLIALLVGFYALVNKKKIKDRLSS